jgi:N-acetylglucosamine kinase-like BadF-type ATPase
MAFGKLYLGVDGGGSNTRSLLVDHRCNPIGLGNALGCNPHNYGFKMAGARIDEAVADAIESLESESYEIAAIYCGVAGIRTTNEKARLADSLAEFPWRQGARLNIDSDLSIAHEAGLGSSPGVCLVIGTGAACIGKNDSSTLVTHSNRQANGDEPGSGYAIGQDAITAGIVSAVSGERNEVAKAAQPLIELAHAGNIKARQILDQNSDAIADLVRRTIDDLDWDGEKLPLVVTGGVGAADTLYRVLVQEKLTALDSRIEFRFPKSSAVNVAAKRAFSLI